MRQRSGRGLTLLHVSTLAGPGSIAGGVWAVVRAHIAAARHEEMIADVRVIAGWLGRRVPPLPASHVYVPLHRVPGRQGLRALWSLRTPTALRRALEDDIDVVHVHLCRDLFTMIALLVLPRRDRPLVVAQCHGMLGPPLTRWTRLYDRLLTRRLLSRVDVFLALTGEEGRQIQSLGIPPSRVTRIHNAVPEPEVRWSPPAGDPVICFVSRLHERKRPMAVVEAAAELRRRGVHFKCLLAGPDAGEGARLREAISSLGLDGEVELVGPKDPAGVIQLLATSTVFVLPSVAEPYPMAVLEAAAMGTPMIVSADTGVSAILESEGAALVINPDYESLADAISALAGDPRAQLTMSAAARRTYLRHWAMPRLAERLDEVYGMARRVS